MKTSKNVKSPTAYADSSLFRFGVSLNLLPAHAHEKTVVESKTKSGMRKRKRDGVFELSMLVV